nr:hypothetical protein Q903MT_gene4875 [Picea sitchensis]
MRRLLNRILPCVCPESASIINIFSAPGFGQTNMSRSVWDRIFAVRPRGPVQVTRIHSVLRQWVPPLLEGRSGRFLGLRISMSGLPERRGGTI